MTHTRRQRYLTWALLLSTLLCLAGTARAANREPTTQPRAFGRLDEALSGMNLTDDQKQQIDQIKQEAAETLRPQLKGLKNLPPDQRREKLQEALSGVRDQLATVLTPEQMQQLKTKMESMGAKGASREGRQFNLDQSPATQPDAKSDAKADARAQRRGPLLQRMQDNLDKLNLTPDQKQKTDAALADLTANIQKVRQANKGNGQEIRTQGKQYVENFRTQLQSILTPDQLQQLREMMPAGKRDGGNDPPGNAKQPTNMNTPDPTAAKAAAASLQSPATQPNVGQSPLDTPASPAAITAGTRAPDFTLHRLSGSTVTLKSFVDKPLVLVFGSYTSPSFRDRVPQIEALQAKYRFSVNFLIVYTREAHAQNEWDVQRNMDDGIKINQPKTLADRTQLAVRSRSALKITTDIAVDDMDDTVAKEYQAGQDGATVISRLGDIVGTQKWCDPSGLGIMVDKALHENE